jgi:hypothetical protein
VCNRAIRAREFPRQFRLDLQRLRPRATVVPFKGGALRVIGREDFIAMKVFEDGPQDLADAAAAFAAVLESLDMPLLRQFATRYGRDASITLKKLLVGGPA